MMSLSIIVSIIGCAILKKIFLRLSIIDTPNSRSSHEKPTILGGGVAFLAVFAILTIVGYPSLIKDQPLIMIGLGVLFIVSFFDDIKTVSSRIRFGIHLLVANMIYFSGVKMASIDLPFLSVILNKQFSYGCTILFIVALINIYNFMDGIDGYATGMGIFSALFFSQLFFMMGDSLLAGICLILAGALIGFLLFNFPMPKASIFMGDVGSAVLGAIFAIFSIKYSMHSFEPTHSIIVPIIILSNFIFDATCTICIRLYKKENILTAHRSHFYQKLNIIGWSHQQIIWLEYLHILMNLVCAYIYIKSDNQIYILGIILIGYIIKFTLIQRSFKVSQDS